MFKYLIYIKSYVYICILYWFCFLGKHWLRCKSFLVINKSSVTCFPGGSEVKASAYYAGDLGSIPGSGRSPGEGNDNPLQYSCLENPTDGGAWWATVHGVAKSRTWLSDFTFTFTWAKLGIHFDEQLLLHDKANGEIHYIRLCVIILGDNICQRTKLVETIICYEIVTCYFISCNDLEE